MLICRLSRLPPLMVASGRPTLSKFKNGSLITIITLILLSDIFVCFFIDFFHLLKTTGFNILQYFR